MDAELGLRELSDEALHSEIVRCSEQAREMLVRLLYRLRENERRRLYAKYKYPSLFAYLMGELKFSESEAVRRISAMRLLKEFPGLEDEIRSGSLNLTHLNLAQTAFSRERKAGRPVQAAAKLELLGKIAGKSTRQAKRIVCQASPEMAADHRPFTFDEIDDDLLREKLLLIRGRWASKHPNLNLNELLHILCDQELSRIDQSPSAPKVTSKAEIARQVRRRDQGSCTNCGSKHGVEIDHILPEAAGGSYTLANLRLLCRACNQRAAIEFYGLEKMDRYLNGKLDPAAAQRKQRDTS